MRSESTNIVFLSFCLILALGAQQNWWVCTWMEEFANGIYNI